MSETDTKPNDHPIRVGISTCLLGRKVRYDGGHKHDRYVTDVLGKHFEFVPVCPELEAGMGVPRESVRLEGDPDNPRLVGNKTSADWTERVKSYSAKRIVKTDITELCGFIFKKNSPSCGMERVKVHSDKGVPIKQGVGLFAGALMEKYPLLPVEEEGRLNDHRLRENFIIRVFAYHRLKQLFRSRYSRGRLVDFHTRHKFLLLAHSPKHYSELGKLVAAAAKYSPGQMAEIYGKLFMEALRLQATTRKNVNVLNHIVGFMKNYLDRDTKAYILDVIGDYHRGLVPLIVPVTLMRHYIDRYDIEYIRHQHYLNPHPKELMLRNHV
jgi:uncharacterized protein YbgA (DUF1722 family)/uncharacterized protein YbbK (DUF523 family)